MSPLTRRELGMVAVAGMVRLKPDATETFVSGVRLGVQTYSFRAVPRTPDGDAINPIVRAMAACGFDECELYAPQVEPAGKSRDAIRAWRLETPLDYFRDVKRKFDAGKIGIYAYNYSPNASYTDEEIGRGFDMARALGAEIITSSTTLAVAPRIVPFAEKYRMVVAMHGHSNTRDPDEFSTPTSFADAMKLSKYFKVNLDIGHFTASGFDAVSYIREHHANITNLHLKDRKKDQGANVPWGQGDTPIREVLQLLKRERWPIRAYVEYEYPGQGSPVDEVKRCYAFARESLG